MSVAISAFNEGTEIGRTLQRVRETLEPLRVKYELELIVVDDGSSDETPESIAAFAARYPDTRVCTHETNRGLVEGLKTAARAANGEVIVYLDADLSYIPEIVEPLVDTLVETGAAVVIASPYMSGGRVGNVPADRLVASRVANWLLARCVGGRIKTFTGMVRAYQTATLLDIMGQKTHGEFNAWVIAELLRRRARIVEIPAALVWPLTRTQAPSRMSLVKLWMRFQLVVTTALTLASAASAGRVKKT